MLKKYRGVVVPLITPFTRSQRLDENALQWICKNCANHQISVLVLGTTGESTSISRTQSIRSVEVVAGAIKGKTTIYACLSGNCIEENIESARAFTTAGADVIVSLLPSYYDLKPSEMFTYYKILADSCSIPVMIYNIPSTTKMSIPLEIVDELSRHPNILGFKDSERDIDRVSKSIELFHNREDFSFFVGYAAISAQALKMGADGIIPSTANIVPGMFKELYDHSISGNWDEAQRIQRETDEIAKIYQEGRKLGESLQALKVMMSEICPCLPVAIPPLSELGMDDQNEIRLRTRQILGKYNIFNERFATFKKKYG